MTYYRVLRIDARGREHLVRELNNRRAAESVADVASARITGQEAYIIVQPVKIEI